MDRLLKLTDIEVSDRFRKDYGDMPDLCRRIRSTKGLQFNKVLVEEIDDHFKLLAGGRRVRAYELLSQGDEEAWQGHQVPELKDDAIIMVDAKPTQKDFDLYLEIPCEVMVNLSPVDRLRVEYIENKGRKDFLWQEEAELVAAYHTQQQQVYGVANPGPGKDGWSTRDTARELGLNSADVVHLLNLAAGTVKDPTLKEIKQKSKALTKLKRNKRNEIADLLNLEDYTTEDIKILCNDSAKELVNYPDESFDMVITDPPWGINFEERTKDDRTETYIEYDNNFDVTKTLDVLIQCHRVLRPNCPIYMFYSSLPNKVIEGMNLLKGAGFETEIIPLIWYKKHVLAHDARETRHGLNYETILYGWKGERPFLNEAHRNVFEFQVAYQNRIHASEKPEGLLSELVLLHTTEGARVLDPFGGSCRLADSCKATFRKCIVIEKEEELVKLANLRLRGI